MKLSITATFLLLALSILHPDVSVAQPYADPAIPGVASVGDSIRMLSLHMPGASKFTLTEDDSMLVGFNAYNVTLVNTATGVTKISSVTGVAGGHAIHPHDHIIAATVYYGEYNYLHPNGTSTGGWLINYDTVYKHDILVEGSPCHQVDFSADGTKLVFCRADADSGRIEVWSYTTRKELRHFGRKIPIVGSIELSPDNLHVVAAINQKIIQWNTETGVEEWRSIDSGEALDARYYGDGSRVITWNNVGAHLWNAANGKKIRDFPHGGGIARGASITQKGTFVVTIGTDSLAHIWNAGTGSMVQTLKLPGGDPRFARWSHDGKRIFIVDLFDSVTIWTVSNLPNVGVAGESGPATRLDAFPNPARSTVQIDFDVSHGGPARVAIVDLLGNEVATLLDESIPQGRYSLQWQCGGVANGRYLCVLRSASGSNISRQIIVEH